MTGTRRFRVLVVCQANRCRSPLGEHLLRAAATERGLPWEIESAGLVATEGAPMDPSAAAVLAERGIAATGWTSRLLHAGLLARADLVLTMEARHRAASVTLEPSALRRTFTLLQFTRLAEAGARSTGRRAARVGLDSAGEAVLAAAIAARALVHPAPDQEDVADPMGRAVEEFRRCADLLADAADRITSAAMLLDGADG